MSEQISSIGPRKKLIDDEQIFAQIACRKALMRAWTKVFADGGAAGGDGVRLPVFARRAEKQITALCEDLREGRYQPCPIRYVDIPTGSGDLWRLPILSIIDRIAQSAAANVLTPLFDAEFEEASFGYRPGRSSADAVARIQMLRQSGFSHIVDANIENFFDNVPHKALIARLGESMTPGPLSQLIALWLDHGAPQKRGLAQGAPLTPLLANLYLDRLDEAFDKSGTRIIRFADDFVILTKSRKDAETVRADIAQLLEKHGLRLNHAKTRVTDFDRGFQFLGHMFMRAVALEITPEQAGKAGAEQALAALARREEAEDASVKQASTGGIAKSADESLAEKEKRGYSPGLRNLYIMQAGRRLSLRNQAFAVEERTSRHDKKSAEKPQWRELIAVPHQHIDRIDIGPRAEATNQALDHALATDTIVCFLNGHGATRGMLAPVLGARAERHFAQAATALDNEKRLSLARLLVRARLRNQRALLRKLCRERTPLPSVVAKAISELTRLIGRGDVSRIAHAPDINSVMGYEGAAAAAYWPAIGALAAEPFRFKTRQRREHPNRANIALNFLSWLLHRDISVAVLKAGLHPGFGALHSLSDNRDACVYDLMEEFRAHSIEGLFVYLGNRRILRADMFEKRREGGWRMRPAGANALIRAYETRAGALITWPPNSRRVSLRRLMVEQAHRYANHVEKDEVYQPFEIDY